MLPRSFWSCSSISRRLISFQAKTIIEPFRIKMVEPIPMLTKIEREKELKNACYNLFKVRSQSITIDLMTDSGTCAMSQDQWSAMMQGDESYARAKSWYKFEQAIQDIMGYKHIFPGFLFLCICFFCVLYFFAQIRNKNHVLFFVFLFYFLSTAHQGRAAERLLFSSLLKPQHIVPGSLCVCVFFFCFV